MSLNNAIFLNGILDLGVVLAILGVTRATHTFDRPKDEATVYAFAAPLPEDLAA